MRSSSIPILPQVIQRVARKAAIFGQDIEDAGEGSSLDGDVGEVTYKISPDAAAQLYKETIMPLTKKVEVEYLLHRLDPPCGV